MPIGLGLGLGVPLTPPATVSGPGAGVDNLLLEDGTNLLLETGDAILLE